MDRFCAYPERLFHDDCVALIHTDCAQPRSEIALNNTDESTGIHQLRIENIIKTKRATQNKIVMVFIGRHRHKTNTGYQNEPKEWFSLQWRHMGVTAVRLFVQQLLQKYWNKHRSSAVLALKGLVRGIHQSVMWKLFPWHCVIMFFNSHHILSFHLLLNDDNTSITPTSMQCDNNSDVYHYRYHSLSASKYIVIQSIAKFSMQC